MRRAGQFGNLRKARHDRSLRGPSDGRRERNSRVGGPQLRCDAVGVAAIQR
jgi:hypothetical protein